MIPAGENRDWSKDVFPQMLAEDAPLFGCQLSGNWADIGNTDAYLEASRAITHRQVRARIDERPAEGRPDIYLGEDVLVATKDRSLLEGMVVLGDNTQVLGRARLKNTVVGRNCVIEDGCELEDAVLWDNVYLKKGCRIQGAGLCHNVRVGQGVVIEEGVIVGDETTIGDEAYLKKDIKVWPLKVIEGGAIVTTNLIWGEKWRKSLFEGAVVRGLTNVELTPEFSAKLGAAYGSTLPKDSFILAGRDAIRASRMHKRSFLGGLLSAGINVRDTKMVSLPVLRYKLTTFGEVGGVHFRQSPEDPAATEIIFFDAEGIEVSSAARGSGGSTGRLPRPLLRAGSIPDSPIYDYYREGYLRASTARRCARRRQRVVDLNPPRRLLPGLLNDLGCEVTELSSARRKALGTSPEQWAALGSSRASSPSAPPPVSGSGLPATAEADRQRRSPPDIEALYPRHLVCQAERRPGVPVPAPLAIEGWRWQDPSNAPRRRPLPGRRGQGATRAVGRRPGRAVRLPRIPAQLRCAFRRRQDHRVAGAHRQEPG
jgi:mannose-1-phosphate guanylyltransferase/phosphomannomutase